MVYKELNRSDWICQAFENSNANQDQHQIKVSVLQPKEKLDCARNELTTRAKLNLRLCKTYHDLISDGV